MKRFLKLIAIFLVGFILLAVFLLAGLILFVNPNRFKPMITAAVMNNTGRELIIDGDLSWTVFPSLGVKVGRMHLTNPEGFKQKTFAEIERAVISVKVLPLFDSKVESSGVILEGIKLNLIKAANGHTNWEFQKTAAPVGTLNTKDEAGSKKAYFALAISGVDISHADINWIDEQTNQQTSLKDLSLHAKNINLMRPFPISMTFRFENNQPLVSGYTKLNSTVSLNLEKQVYSLRDFSVITQIKREGREFDLSLNANIAADLTQQTVECSDFKATLANLSATGSMEIKNLNKAPQITGRFRIEPFDLKQWLQKIGNNLPAIQSLKNASGDIRFTAISKSMTAEGQFKIDEAQANNIKVTRLTIPVHFQSGVADFSPVAADFYQGGLQAQIKVNTHSALPEIDVKGRIANADAGLLLHDLGGDKQKLKFTGKINADVQVTTSGTDSATAIRNLNGTSRFNVNNGALEGIDIAYLLDSASAVLGGKSLATNNTGQTPFSTMSGSAVIRSGVMTNNDLLIASSRFDTKGSGVVDLVNQRINYDLQTEIKQADQSQKNNIVNLYGLAVPIRIAGDLNNPTIRLDTSALAKAVTQQQLKKVEDKVQDQIKKKLPEAGKILENLLGR